MQVAHLERTGHYLTVKDNQVRARLCDPSPPSFVKGGCACVTTMAWLTSFSSSWVCARRLRTSFPQQTPRREGSILRGSVTNVKGTLCRFSGRNTCLFSALCSLEQSLFYALCLAKH